MADKTVNEGATTPPDYSTLNAAVAAATTGQTIEIQGTWDSDDTTSVAWDVDAIVTADADAKQQGRPYNASTDATGGPYRHREGSGHAFTVTNDADVTITGINIQSDSGNTSDELFRSAGAAGCVITNCQLGFTGNTTEQDVWYTESESTRTLDFIQCFFYDVGRSVVDFISPSNNTATLTINFNSCGSFNIGADGARSDGCIVGIDTLQANNTIAIRSHNCLFDVDDFYLFSASDTTGAWTVHCNYSILSIEVAAIANNKDSEDVVGSVGGYTWTTTPSTGDQVGLTNITSGTYDPALVDDADNDAQTFHATVTDAGLTIPDLDILGQTRDKATPSFDCGPSALTLAAGGLIPLPRYTMINQTMIRSNYW